MKRGQLIRKILENVLICLVIGAISAFSTVIISANASRNPIEVAEVYSISGLQSTGKGIWIWKIWEVEDGNLSTIIERVESTGIGWVIIKCGDSDSYWLTGPGYDLYDWAKKYGGFNNVINQFHSSGIKVFGWHFVYSYDHWGIPDVSEADVSNRILDIPGIDGLIINAEEDYEGEGKGPIAEQYLIEIRNRHPSSFIAYSSFARITDAHEWFPWLEFGRYSDDNMPQCYWAVRYLTPEEELRRMKEDFDKWHKIWEDAGFGDSVKPIIPVGQGWDVSGDEIMRFYYRAIDDYEYQGMSLFRYGTMTEEMWNAYASCGESQPDLTPYKPSGWSDKIVVSKVTGTHTDDPKLTPNDTLYVDWAVANQGDADITDLFYYYLYVDGEYVAGWYSDGLRAGYYAYIEDYSIGKLSAGPHTIKIFADATRVISESDEGNNEYSKPISIEEGKPNPPTLVSPPNGSHQTCSITFQWTSVSGATKYKLFVKLPGSSSWLSDETTATTYPYSPTLMGEYHWKVQAYANGNWSDDSSEWIFYFDGVTAPTLISPPNGSEITDLRPTFRWNSVACANWYQLQLARDSSFTDLVRDKWNIYDTFWQLDQDLDKGQTYYWRVCSQNPIGHWSDVWHFRISPQQYTLTTSVNPSGSGSISLNPPGGTYDAGTVVTLTANPNTGWKFNQWSGDLSGSENPKQITMNGNKNVTANFTKIQYTLTTSVNPSGSGSVTLNPSGGTYDAGTVVTLTANPASCWEFDHWSGDLSGSSNPDKITMDSDKDVTANFTKIRYTIVVSPDCGSVSLNPPGGTYDCGTVVTLTANPNPGCMFDHWSGDLSGSSNPTTITMDSDKNVTAHFVCTLTTSVSPSDSGSVSLNPPGGTYDCGTVVTLTANPNSGWEFDHWSGDLSGSANPDKITMNEAKDVTAHFERKTGSLTVTINPPEVRDEARWRLTSGPDTSWKRSGETISNIPTGDYTLQFNEVSGWNKPDDKTVTISEGDNFETGTYEQGPSITLTAPNGGECIKGGSSLNVTWKTSGSGIDHIRLLYSTDSGNTYPNTIIASTQDDGTYEWTTPLIDSSTVRVKAIAEDASNNALAEDESDGDFIIDSTPPETTITLFGTQGDNSWYISDVTVELNATDNLCGVKKTEYKINELEWQPYSSEFTISSEGTTTVYYRSEDNAGNIEPEKTEAIKIDKTPPSVTLTSPIGGENWAVGTTHDITWTAEDTTSGVASIKIEYSTDSGSTWKPIADGEENDGTYSWTIPDDKSEYCRVKVTAYDNASNEASDASDSDFTITDEGEPISGTITDGVNPIPATVQAWNAGTIADEVSTSDGSYVLHLPAGAYAIRAYSAGYYAAVLKDEITPPATNVNLSLEKAPNVTITNKICDFWSQDLTSFDWQTKHIPLEVQIGDVITAQDPNGIICGIATVGESGTDEGDYFIHVYGDDATTPDVDEGAEEGDTITFFINGYPASVISGTPQWHSGGSFEVSLSATISKTVEINLRAPWNFLSFNVVPPLKDIETVLSPIDGLYTYVRGMERGGTALTYVPGRPFNDLEQLEPLHGYEIKMSSDAILPVTGMPVSVTTPIELRAPWNFISYLPDVTMPIEDALASIDGLYTYVRGMERGGTALTYVPGRPFNDLEQLEPLHGYEIKMSSDGTLVYPSSVSLLAMQTTTHTGETGIPMKLAQAGDFVLPRASVPENQKPSNNQVLISNLAPALGSEAISGTVTDGIDAIQNATVQAWQKNQKIQETITAPDGSYTLSGLAGTHIVRAHKEGFYAIYLDNQPAPSNGVNVVLESLPSVISTNLVCDFWSMDSATYSGGKPLLQIGDVVTAIDPDGVICGVTTVGEFGTDEGDFFLHVYGDDPTTPDIDEGATEGDTITLMLNKYYPIKDVNPQPVWHVSDSIQLTLVQFDRTLPVSLTAATATRVGDQIILRWITESETNNLGWDVYRSNARDGKYRKINAAMIAGAGTSAEPHTYRFIDENVEAGKVYFYYLENIDFDGKRHKSHLIQVEIVTTLGQIKYSALYPNFPNPFNPETWIPFKLASDSPVVINIYDIKGKLVRRLDLGHKKSGYYLDRRSAAHWDGRSQTGERVASGIYLYTIKAGKFTATRRMVVVK